MLLPQLEISQDRCNTLIIKDITPPYSPTQLGGYGGINIEADRIIWSVLTLHFANGQVYSVATNYNQTKGEWALDARDLPVENATNLAPCSTCGQEAFSIQHLDKGRMSAFPTGCILAKYEVFSADIEETTGKKLEGTKVTKFISKCEQTNKVLELVDKFTLPDKEGGFPGINNQEERNIKLAKLNLAWMKLELLESAEGCDCDCIAAAIKQAEQYLLSIDS